MSVLSPSAADRRVQSRTLTVAAAGTLLILGTFTMPLATLTSIAAGLDASVESQAWILSSISIGLAAGLLTSGSLADDYGRRRAFVVGAVLLAFGSVGCALAPTPPVFVLARVAQGLGGAAIVASSLGLIGHAFPPGAGRIRATGIWGACVGAGIAIGPLLAVGMDDGFGWPAPYWLVAVLSVLVAIAGRLLLTESRSADPQRIDVAGVVLLGAGLACLLAGLVEGRNGWGEPIVAILLGAGILVVVAFIVVEHRGSAPMLDLRLFGRPDFVAVTTAALATGLGVIGLMSFSPTFIQRGLGASALAAAVVLLCWSGTSVVTALAARRLPGHIHPRVQLAVGMTVVAAGQLMLFGLSPDTTIGRLIPGLLVAGAGSGFVNAGLGREAVASVPAGRASMGSGANNTARYVGSAVGVTIVAVVATSSGTGAAGLAEGWNAAAIVTAAFSLLGALAVYLSHRSVARTA